MARYFITGGAGFLGRAFANRLRETSPADRITVYSRDQSKHARMERLYRHVRCIQGDIQDYERLQLAMAGHDVVIHMAASKYVDRAESDALGTIAVNINGSVNVALAAMECGVKVAIAISTDKAVEPVNTYGMSKALMERVWAQANDMADTRFVAVRYGNVVSSTGSVVPLFQSQMQEQGKIQLTDPTMTRFWLGIEEAVDIIAEALLHADDLGSGVLVPDVRSCSMQTVAEAVWHRFADVPIESTWGEALRNAETPQITVIGQRPGEKIHESLLGMKERRRAEWVDWRKGWLVIWPPDEVSDTPLDADPLFSYSSEDAQTVTAEQFNGYIDQATAYEAKVYE